MRLLDPRDSPRFRHETQPRPHPAPDKELNSRQVSKAPCTRWRTEHGGADKDARPHRAPPAYAARPTDQGPSPDNTLPLATTCAPGAAAGTRRLRGTCSSGRCVSGIPRVVHLPVPLRGWCFPHPLRPKSRFALRALTSPAPRSCALLCVRRRSQPQVLHGRGWERNSRGPAIQGVSFYMSSSARTRAGGARGAQVPAPSLSAAGALGAVARSRRAGGVVVARAGGALCGRGTGRPN